MQRILVLCTGNSCRSQMAEGYLRHFAGDRAEVMSAGIEAHGLNPRAVAVMNEDGIDIAHHASKTVEGLADGAFQHVITVCDHAKENCPWFPGPALHYHHDFPDPARATGTEEEVVREFREVRDMIKVYCRAFLAALD